MLCPQSPCSPKPRLITYSTATSLLPLDVTYFVLSMCNSNLSEIRNWPLTKCETSNSENLQDKQYLPICFDVSKIAIVALLLINIIYYYTFFFYHRWNKNINLRYTLLVYCITISYIIFL